MVLERLCQLLAAPSLRVADVYDLYYDTVLENALLPEPDEARNYTEEFVANAAYLLELDLEGDARLQLEAARSILIAYHR